MKEFVTVDHGVVQYEEVINRSRFVTHATRTDTVEEAQDFVASIKKQYYDATHNCFAYVVDGAVKYSDDKEPSGTAGKPILDVIVKNNLNRITVVVTRYFGGILLGAGGLVRAYSSGASGAVALCKRVPFTLRKRLTVKVDYALTKPMTAQLNKLCLRIENVEYATEVTFCCVVDSNKAEQIVSDVTDLACGKAICSLSEEYLGE